MKLLGAILLTACAGLIGVSLRDRLRRRAGLLAEICVFIERLSCAVEHARTSPDRVIVSMNVKAGSFLGMCATRVKGGVPLRDAWARVEEGCPDVGCLSLDERDCLHELGTGLGRTDAHSQLVMLEQYTVRFRAARENAAGELKRRSTMYITCPLLLGIAAALVII